MLSETEANRFSAVTLRRHAEDVFCGFEIRTELFQDLVRSYPDRIETVKKANGRDTNY